MRKVTSSLFSSVDGVVESPNLWQFDHFDEDMGPAMEAALADMDTVLMGRKTYEQWAGYWPDPAHDDGFGDFINPVRKYVASRTLDGPLEWENSSLIEGGLEDFVTALRGSEGGTIGIQGSISVVRQLLFAGLLDELTLMVHPVVAGGGERLFRPEDPTTRLELKSSRITSSGNALLTYARRAD
ncbi:dihydrofolate reductase family protein [Arthrobacter sp. zg-Y1143]|uniref:dihydrofolate reductase family protein n=1 Tax=Arthrobacter sp. zg-Y1143 TaxID=3049065 RepID=UPI0024C309A6|nr:dihydrofolate reductase family protein [Arthrobacter sp. zg-Y1143]MDK1327396.1 dihydrofolate reductase family protein [Arthrobacter sp. zg-Y1143]